jgi:hypothetical protein
LIDHFKKKYKYLTVIFKQVKHGKSNHEVTELQVTISGNKNLEDKVDKAASKIK